MAATNNRPELVMHGYFRSSCTGRLRIAMNLKDLEYSYVPVDLRVGFQSNAGFAKINPQRTVPALFVAGKAAPITQSLAALEFFEDAYPDTPALLPSDVFEKALVRSLVNLVVADIQPVTNSRVVKKITQIGYDGPKWSREYHAEGFTAFEELIKDVAGEYSFGNQITLADVCLAPAVWNAERWGLDMSLFPTINKVYKNASKHPAFVKGHWTQQPDCPEDLR